MSLTFRSDIDLSGLTDAVAATLTGPLTTAMEHIRQVAVSRTPIEEGTLRRSATVKVQGLNASIRYDGPYARYQHEKLELRHEVGQAKFLESALFSESKTALNIIATAVRRNL